MSFLPDFCFMSSSHIIKENPSKFIMEEAANPLFSSFVTLYALLLIYFPCYFLQIAFSPLLISTAILLLSLLRLGANQIQRKSREIKTESCLSGTGEIQFDPVRLLDIKEKGVLDLDLDLDLDPPIGWSVGAPLEVIYEDYEGEEEEEDDEIDSVSKMERYPSLSLYYPETDSDVSSTNGEIQDSGEWESPERIFFRWEEKEEEDRDGLIEIALDCKGKGDFFNDEDENLIEIDIFPARIRGKIEFSGVCQVEIN